MKINLSTLIPFKISQLTKLKRQLVDQQMQPLNLSRTQWQVLAWLNILGTPCTQQGLLKALDLDRAQLARVLEYFDEKKIIKRTALPDDRRSLSITLTPSGKTLLKKVEYLMEQESDIMLKGITQKEKELFDSLLHKMTENILSSLKDHE